MLDCAYESESGVGCHRPDREVNHHQRILSLSAHHAGRRAKFRTDNLEGEMPASAGHINGPCPTNVTEIPRR